MNATQTFAISSLHAPTVLPRVALIFSRRGVTIERLEMHALDEGDHAVMSLDASCDAEEGRKIAAQLRRIVEVTDIRYGATSSALESRKVG